jgi:hypothetical protein
VVVLWLVTTLGMSSLSDDAACLEGTVDVLLHRPRVALIWRCGHATSFLCVVCCCIAVGGMAGRHLLIISGVVWDEGGQQTHRCVLP